jgi:apolipoprotein N-acyltransferase
MAGIPPRFRALSALIAGALTPLAFAPFDLWPLIFITPAILYSLIRHTSVKQSLWYGWVFGVGFYGVGVSWVFRSIHDFGGTPLLLAVLMTALFALGLALFFMLQTYLYARWFSRKGFSVAGFVGTWMFAEWLRSWFLTGFPWLYSGYALIDTPFSALAPMGGVWLVSFVCVTISACLVNLFTAKTLPQRALCAATITVLCALPLLDREWTQPKGEPFDVDIVQANIPQDLKWNPNYLPDFLMRYVNITQEQTRAPVVVWPETAVSAIYSEASPYLFPLLQQFDQDQRILISGIPSLEFNPQAPDGYDVFNSLAVLTGDGDVYHKQRLVPFGEYVPFQALLRKLGGFFDLPMSSFSLPAPGQGPLEAGHMKVSAAICYEIAYPELVRETAQDSDWLITVSNDTWFSHTIAPDQHLQIARMRALENGRWLVRSTNNGLTALIAPDGKISMSIPAYKEGVLHGTIQSRNGHTPYQRWGLWPVAVMALALLLLAFQAGTRRE